MKTTKVFLVIAILSFATMGFSQEKSSKSPLSVKMTISQAQQNFNLVVAMYQQLDPGSLQNEPNGFYVAQVIFKSTPYLIYGTLNEWKTFFSRSIHDYAVPGAPPPQGWSITVTFEGPSL